MICKEAENLIIDHLLQNQNVRNLFLYNEIWCELTQNNNMLMRNAKNPNKWTLGEKKFFCQKPFAETYSHPKTFATYNELIL